MTNQTSSAAEQLGTTPVEQPRDIELVTGARLQVIPFDFKVPGGERLTGSELRLLPVDREDGEERFVLGVLLDLQGGGSGILLEDTARHAQPIAASTLRVIADLLDERDYRDRIDVQGDRWTRLEDGTWTVDGSDEESGGVSPDWLNHLYGPLTPVEA